MKDKNKKKVRQKINLPQSEVTLLQSIIGEIPALICRFQINGNCIFVNKNFCKYLGKEKEHLLYKKIFPQLPKKFQLQLKDVLKKVKKNKSEKIFLTIDKTSAQKEKPYKWTVGPIYNKQGKIAEYQLSGLILSKKELKKENIKERNKFEAALLDSEKRFKALVESTTDWIWEIDKYGSYTYSSPKVKDLLGYEPYEIIGQSPFDFMPSEEAERVKEIFKDILQSQKPFTALENINIHKSGKRIVLETSGVPMVDDSGKFQGFRGIDRDISERKQAEQQIIETNALLSAIFESSPEVIVFALDKEYRYIAFNTKHEEAIKTIWGQEIEIGMNMLEVIGKLEDRYKAKANFDRALSGESFTLIEEYGDEKLARLFWQDYYSPIYSSDNKIVGLTCFVQNVTERKLVEEALQKSEMDLKKAQKVAHVGSWTWDIKNNKVSWSDEMYRLFGIEPESFSGDLNEVINKTIHPDDLPKVFESTESVMKFKKPIPLEYRIVLPNGFIRIVWAEAGELIQDQNRNPVFLSGIVQDITERKLAEEKIKIHEEQLRQITDNMVDLIGRFDPNAIFQYVSPSYEKTLGYKPEELIGKSATDFLYPPKKEEVINAISSMLRADSGSVQFQYRHKDGNYRWFESTGRYIKDDHGNVTGSIMGSRDITERIKAEAQIKRMNEELKELNRNKDKFFSIFAHDLKSPFQALLGMSELISDPEEELTPEEMKEYGSKINSLLKNQYVLLQNLLDWSRLQLGRIDIKETQINLYEAVNSVLSILYGISQKKNIHIINDIETNINVNADTDMLRSILQNFISNSIKFTNKNGIVKISAKYTDDFAQIIIEDTGIGIPKEGLYKIFKLDEKFTTEGTEGESGSGLGIMLCKEMIEKQGGKLEIESEINKGTVVKFTMPLSS